MKIFNKHICKILIYIFICLVLLGLRTYWDSYRFYKKAIELENNNIILSIRYYGNSIRSKPIVSIYSNKAKEKLKKISRNKLSDNIELMIEDELQN